MKITVNHKNHEQKEYKTSAILNPIIFKRVDAWIQEQIRKEFFVKFDYWANVSDSHISLIFFKEYDKDIFDNYLKVEMLLFEKQQRPACFRIEEVQGIYRVTSNHKAPLVYWDNKPYADFATFSEACRCVTIMTDREQDHADNWDAVSEARMQC